MANAQTEAMKAMMRNPKTGKLFKDALSSPIGSTSRAQVKKIFSIMGKLQSSRDGVGGPGMMMERESQPADTYGYSAAADEPQSMVVFHKLPEMNINFEGHPHESSKKSATAMDGAGGPGDAAADGTAGTGGVGDWGIPAKRTYGVLKITLNDTGYIWDFVSVDGGQQANYRGTGNCLAKPGK